MSPNAIIHFVFSWVPIIDLNVCTKSYTSGECDTDALYPVCTSVASDLLFLGAFCGTFMPVLWIHVSFIKCVVSIS